MPSVQQEITKKLARATILLRTPQVPESKVRSNWSATRKRKDSYKEGNPGTLSAYNK